MALAAEQLGASPSAVSQQISNLERALGARLFDRAARPIALTPAGKLVRRYALRIFEAVSEVRTELMELQLSALPELRLGIIDDVDVSLTPELVGHLHELYPGCTFSATSGRSDLLTAALLRWETDIVVTAEPPEEPSDFDLHPLLREPYIMVAARDVVDESRDVREQLLELPFVHYSDSMPMGRDIARHCRRLKLNLPQRYAFDASRSVFAVVRNCRGWAITTPLCVLDCERFRPDLDIRPLPFPGISRTIYLVARREELGRLPEKLATMCRDLIDKHLVPAALEITPWAEGSLVTLDSETGLAGLVSRP